MKTTRITFSQTIQSMVLTSLMKKRHFNASLCEGVVCGSQETKNILWEGGGFLGNNSWTCIKRQVWFLTIHCIQCEIQHLYSTESSTCNDLGQKKKGKAGDCRSLIQTSKLRTWEEKELRDIRPPYSELILSLYSALHSRCHCSDTASDTEANMAEHEHSPQKCSTDRCAAVLWPQTMLKCWKQPWLRCFHFWRESHDNL